MWYDLSWAKRKNKWTTNNWRNVWNLAEKIHIPENVQQRNTEHKHLTKKKILKTQAKQTTLLQKKKEQNVKILYVCISSFSYTYQMESKQKIETKIITIS